MGLLATWLDRAAEASPEAPALIGANETLSHRQLRERSHALAQQLGLAQGMTVAVPSGSNLDLTLRAHAASRLGCALLPLNPALPAERRAVLMQITGAQAAASPTPHNDIELFIATSGTEGEAKAVMLSGANLQAAVFASRQRLPLTPGDAWLACLPLYHIGGMAILYRCAEAGATVVLHESFDAQRVLADLEKFRISHISLVPAMLAKLLDAGKDGPPPASLGYALIGGGPLSDSLMRRARAAGWPLCASYGMSEAGSQVATQCRLAEDWQPGQVGSPLPGVEVEIVDEQGRPTAGIGRIRIRGAAVMAGYANPQRLPRLGLDQGWFVSGDLGSMDAEGKLTVLGRHDDVLVSGGVNVHPQAVEDVLKRCPGVADAALTAIADAVWGELLVAVVVGDGSDAALAQWCREQLPGAMRPRRFVRVGELPRNPLGKLERRSVRDLAQQNLG